MSDQVYIVSVNGTVLGVFEQKDNAYKYMEEEKERVKEYDLNFYVEQCKVLDAE